jgi:hypothetical protein
MVFQPILVQYVRAAIPTTIRIKIATTVITTQTGQVRLHTIARHQQAGLLEVTTIREATAITTAGVTTAIVLTADRITAIPADLILLRVQAQVPVLALHLAEAVAVAVAVVRPEGHLGSVSC